MPEPVVVVLAAVLGAAAALKASDRPGSLTALETYGVVRAGPVLWPALVVAEAALVAGLALGSEPAALAGAALFCVFVVAQAAALARGRAGAPCGCAGGRGALSWRSALRAAALAAVLAACAVAGIGASAIVAAAGAAGALLAWLADRAGAFAPRGALSIAAEGPAIGSHMGLGSGRGSAVVLYVEDGCRLCRRVRPAVEALRDELEVHVVEAGDGVPGAPYVVALHDGVVRAKGTVNTRAQVHSVLAEAERARLAEQAGPHESYTPTRRTLIAQAAALAAGAVGATALIRPGEAEAYHFCGHIYTTDSCPHPTGLPRIDARGFPLRARDGHRVDDLGRPIDDEGRPLDDEGNVMTDAEGRPLPSATRTKVCTATGRQYGRRMVVDGAWYRCCKGRVRKLVDCCTTGKRRINGDRALTGYCYRGRRVFCVMYYDTKIRCDGNRDKRVPGPT